MKSIVFEKLYNQTDECYKSLRTNILFCGSDIKVIMVTSCIPNEGKSSVAFELSRSFVQNGSKVLLLDADIRKSVLAGRYKAGNISAGLSSYLSGQANIEDIVFQTNIENMDIIFSGPVSPNPAELVGNGKFDELLAQLKTDYDYIFVDTPPIGIVIDGVIVAPKCDGTILVMQSKQISYRFARNVKKQLDKSNARILGVVLNKLQNGKYGYNYTYYGDYENTYIDYT